MSLRRRWAIAVILLVVCAFPRQGLAQGWEFIFEMSGPGTFVPGSFAYCKVDLGAGDVYECSAAVVRFQERRDLDYWLRLGGDFALSVRNKPEDRQVYTANFDPAFEFRSVNTLATRWPGDPPDKVSFFEMYHGVGLTYNFLFGAGFDGFHKAGLKLNPLVLRWNIGRSAIFELGYVLRVYANEAIDADFGVGPPPSLDKPWEAVHGVTGLITVGLP